MLVPRVDQITACHHTAHQKPHIPQDGKLVGKIYMQQIHQQPKYGPGSPRATEHLAPDQRLAVLLVDEDIEGEVQGGHGYGVEDCVAEGADGLEMGGVGSCCGVGDGWGADSAIFGVEFALAVFGELEEGFALGAGAVGVFEQHFDGVV